MSRSSPAPPVDGAQWKQADYGQMAHAHEVAQADEAKPWWRRTWQSIVTAADAGSPDASLLLEATNALEYDPRDVAANYTQLASE